MNQDLALKVLGQIMNWTDERARREFSWVKLMARLKYDGYRDFQAGMRFTESLATWLQQFQLHEREIAYAFVRHSLVYVGPSEMQRLVEQFYPRTVRERLVRTVSNDHDVLPYRVLVDPNANIALTRLRRQTLFMGLSDGSRIDTIRHANSRLLSNEQFVYGTQVDPEKWKDLLDNLREDLEDRDAQFRLIYLVDDFAGTATSLLRFDQENNKWKGKLIRFRDSLKIANNSLDGVKLLEDRWELCIHYYMASSAAVDAVNRRLGQVPGFPQDWARATHLSFGTVLPPQLPIDAVVGRHDEFRSLTQTYYDAGLRTRHTDVGGTKHLGLGYGGCALPLVLDHNTPNNAVALLWAETDGRDRDGVIEPAMRPLFRRRQRHG